MKLHELFESKDEHEAVIDYLRDSSWFNYRLRGGRESDELHTSKVKLLDDAIARSEPLTAPLTCYRAIPKDKLEEYQVGDTYTDKGYVSLTLDKAGANHPGYVHPDDRMVLTIKLPSGTKALNMNTLIRNSEHAHEKAKRLAGWENELLLPRNQKFKIKSLSERRATLEVQ